MTFLQQTFTDAKVRDMRNMIDFVQNFSFSEDFNLEESIEKIDKYFQYKKEFYDKRNSYYLKMRTQVLERAILEGLNYSTPQIEEKINRGEQYPYSLKRFQKIESLHFNLTHNIIFKVWESLKELLECISQTFENLY